LPASVGILNALRYALRAVRAQPSARAEHLATP